MCAMVKLDTLSPTGGQQSFLKGIFYMAMDQYL
jgi:hypothetical protein